MVGRFAHVAAEEKPLELSAGCKERVSASSPLCKMAVNLSSIGIRTGCWLYGQDFVEVNKACDSEIEQFCQGMSLGGKAFYSTCFWKRGRFFWLYVLWRSVGKPQFVSLARNISYCR